MEKNCDLLYKQELGLWIKNQRECDKFHTRDLDLVVEVPYPLPTAAAYPFSGFLTDQAIGHYLEFNNLDRLKLEILRMKDRFYDTITTFKLDGCQQTLCTETKEPKLVGYVQHVKKKLKKEPDLTLSVLVRGSLNGKFFLVYSKYGHLVLMNLETSTGSLIGIWPVDPEDLSIPNLNGAVSKDGSLVAVFGKAVRTMDPSNMFRDPHYYMLRVYDIKSRQCHRRELPIHPVRPLDHNIFGRIYPHCYSVLSFNPSNQNLLYFMATKDGSLWPSYEADDIHLVLYDLKEEKILATRRECLLTAYMGSTLGYKNIEGPVFLHHGEIIIVYHMTRYYNGQRSKRYDYIGLLDAFSLDTIATVNLPRSDAEICLLRYHFLISTCETEIAVFKKEICPQFLVDAHVYKIPCAMSLMRLCRRTIRKATRYKDYKIDELTMLPPKMRNYLKI